MTRIPAKLFTLTLPDKAYLLISSPVGVGICWLRNPHGPATWQAFLPSPPLPAFWESDPLRETIYNLSPEELSEWENINLTIRNKLNCTGSSTEVDEASSPSAPFVGWVFPREACIAIASNKAVSVIKGINFRCPTRLPELARYQLGTHKISWPTDQILAYLMACYQASQYEQFLLRQANQANLPLSHLIT